MKLKLTKEQFIKFVEKDLPGHIDIRYENKTYYLNFPDDITLFDLTKFIKYIYDNKVILSLVNK